MYVILIKTEAGFAVYGIRNDKESAIDAADEVQFSLGVEVYVAEIYLWDGGQTNRLISTAQMDKEA